MCCISPHTEAGPLLTSTFIERHACCSTLVPPDLLTHAGGPSLASQSPGWGGAAAPSWQAPHPAQLSEDVDSLIYSRNTLKPPGGSSANGPHGCHMNSTLPDSVGAASQQWSDRCACWTLNKGPGQAEAKGLSVHTDNTSRSRMASPWS